MIGSLANNGGPVKTHALQAGSPAIDLGFTEGPNCKATDARGVPRPVGGRCDAGDYEYAECHGTLVNRVGTGGRDVITGTGSRDGFLARGGNDNLFGRDGNDGFARGEATTTSTVRRAGIGRTAKVATTLLDGGPDSDLCRGGPGPTISLLARPDA